MKELSPTAVNEAARTLSQGTFFFSPRNLYYELVRKGEVERPGGKPRDELIAFRRDLVSFEKNHGKIDSLIRAKDARRAVPRADMPDIFDYAVRRALVVDRLETFLVLVQNGVLS